MKTKLRAIPSPVKAAGGRGSEAASGLEIRPGGMLVQKRTSDANHNSNPKIKVRVKYGSSQHEITLSPEATFGELKKLLAGPTGLRPQDQKLVFKEKERDSRAFLDVCGVKDGSKIVLLEDELSIERRFLESQKTARMETASKEIAAVRFEVDKLAKQVMNVEMEINGGKKVVEAVLLKLIELLMIELIKLDGVAADGDVKLERRMQVKRVQKYIETLDVLKLRNSGLCKVALQHKIFTGQMPTTHEKQQEVLQRKQLGSLSESANSGAVIVTTKWQTF
ncbi:UNVERIFIED_CONTAM: BAG family molecular chaperone regulator 1 [Sesamum radiatum]|uniref:BAG family molecular chaperone regulator 1 n=2 Tax=Sesamum TaxID=4181 RepID=A0AAW2JNR0_SESRA